MTMIEVENLTKYYGPKLALQEVSFHVQKGEILGLLGPNGAGKSTTMKIIAGYQPASSGTVRVAGYDVHQQSLEVRRRLGYLPETVPLYTDLSVRDYLDFMGKVKHLAGDRRRRRLAEVLEVCHLGDVAGTLIGRLSKGYRQRVGLAQALLSEPDVLVLDEPTIGLDPKQIIETRRLIKSLAGQHSIILSTHILPEVSMTCGRVVIINQGQVVAEDTPENLTRRLRGTERIQVEVRGPADDVAAELRKVPRVVDVESTGAADGLCSVVVECESGSDVREQIAAAVVGAGYGLRELRPLSLSLEEIFLQLTTREEIAA